MNKMTKEERAWRDRGRGRPGVLKVYYPPSGGCLVIRRARRSQGRQSWRR